jgi:hypothetical protein
MSLKIFEKRNSLSSKLHTELTDVGQVTKHTELTCQGKKNKKIQKVNWGPGERINLTLSTPPHTQGHMSDRITVSILLFCYFNGWG